MSVENINQNRASNPFDSVWVSASAGTGKTKVLIDRVLRLILQVTEPEKILCITYTKAAASEMQNRIHRVLQKWATCSQEDLRKEVQELIQEEPDEKILGKARSLFAKALETAGGMKIMTTHSFCQSLLERFPLEAEVSPHFDVLDDLASERVKQQLLEEVLASKEMAPHIQELTYLVSSNFLTELLGRILDESTKLSKLTNLLPDAPKAVADKIRSYFKIKQYQSEKQIITEFCSEEEWPEKKLFYLTKDTNSIRANKKDDPKAYEAYEVNERLKAFLVAHATEVLLRIAFRVVEKYQIIKDENALLDFTDLIEKTCTLLAKSSMSAWVLYKLDGGIDHILVDEAQDTNPSQWQIIKAISEEFFAGEGAKETLRTLFVVGDKKQSIYSVQGANPKIFETIRSQFEQQILASQNSFQNVALNYSFRSTEPILRLVNLILKNNAAKDGVLSEHEMPDHLLNRENDAGLVEIWPVEEAPKKEAPKPWEAPTHRQENESAMKKMIEKMADKIQSMIGKEDLPSQNRKIKAGDILILLQKRTTLMDEIVRILRKRNIPVAGVDKILLSDQLAIQDLIALTEFILQPKNDLNLANLIKSPLLDLQEEDLYKICVNRGTKTVWERVQQLYPKITQILYDYMNMADKYPPFEFYSFVLGAMKGRQKFVARFGTEVNEALDEFLNLTLNFERDNTPSLQVFLDWFSRQPIQIKRDLDNSEIDAVRLMTVHGSKGLQGNIVFLPDTRSTRTATARNGEIIWKNSLPIWVPNRSLLPASLTDEFSAKELLEQQEKRRLLYVAVTRARDRLYICGFGKGGEHNWYDLIKNSLPNNIKPDADGIIRLSSIQKKLPELKPTEKLSFDTDEIPTWANKIPDPEDMPSAPLSPSQLGKDESEDFTPDESLLQKKQELAMQRGTLIHKLLQFLPALPPEQREKYIQQNCPPDIDLPKNLLDIFNHPELKNLFDSNSLAEVPVIGTIDGQMISGQIDRLVILPSEVKIIDFKTNRFVPKEVPDIYKKQLNAYKDLLKTIFPDKIIRGYILWTQTLYFEEI